MPRLEREGEEEEGESSSTLKSTSFLASSTSSSAARELRASSPPAPSPSFSLEAFDDWHTRAWAALGEAANGGGEPSAT